MKRLPALFTASVLLLPTLAWAEEEKGMPQLNFANPLLLSQVVWLALIFLALYLLLAHWGLPLIGSVLEDRARRIAADLDAARGAKRAADEAIAELTAATRHAHAEAQAAIVAATERARSEAAAQTSALNARLQADLAAAEARIAAAERAARGALIEAARETAATIIARLTGRTPEAWRLDAAISAVQAARGAN